MSGPEAGLIRSVDLRAIGQEFLPDRAQPFSDLTYRGAGNGPTGFNAAGLAPEAPSAS